MKNRSFTAEGFLEGEVLLFDKPLHWSSFQLVNKVKWLLKSQLGLKKIKVGHAGTLDPLATGLLIVCTGKMTKSIDTFQAETKIYSGTIKLGATTPSYDLETEIDAVFSTTHITDELLSATAKSFEGTILQKPPIYSAIKKDGKRLYEHARAGETVEIAARPVQIYEFNVDRISETELRFWLKCSKGTYVRSLAHDLGIALQSGAHLTSLRREGSGAFQVNEAYSVASFEAVLIASIKN